MEPVKAMINNLSDSQLFTQLCTESLCLTSSAHAASTLISQFHQLNQDKGVHPHKICDISPLSDWLRSNFSQPRLQSATLLNQSQEKLVWESVISCQLNEYHAHSDSLQAQIASAWRLMQQWQQPLTKLNDFADPQTQLFVRCAKAFVHQYASNHWIDPQLAFSQVIENLDKCSLPKQVFFYQFDTFTPQIEQLINALNQYCKVYIVPPSQPQACELSRIACTDEAAEYQQFANWAKQRLQSNLQQRIGCIVPDLNSCHKRLAAVLLNTFGDNNAFHFNLNRQLGDYPMIQAALCCLSLHTDWTTLAQWQQLLHSPFIATATTDQQHVLYQQLAHSQEPKISLHSIHALLTTLPTYQSLANALTQLQAASSGPALRPSEWSACFHQLLTLFGWPGKRPLISDEAQQLQKWHELLNQYAALDLVADSWDFTAALQQLIQLCEQVPFQPQHSTAPIEFLGPLESGGQQFDALWVMHMSEAHWPRIATPNPFIPKTLQVKWQMPHCDETRERDYCRQLTTRFLQSAPEVIVSHPQQWDDQPCQPSALTKDIPLASSAPPGQRDGIEEALFALNRLLIMRPIEQPVAYSSLERPLTTQTLQNQALCSFRAFAQHRLQAKQVDEPHLGIGPSEHGNMLHQALEYFWGEVNSRAALLALTEEQLGSLIECVVARVIKRWQRTKPYSLQGMYATLEAQKLSRRLQRWLAIEAQRPDFTVVATEEAQTLERWPHPIRVRLDRVDQIGDKTLLIDYKTGNVQLSPWFTEPLLAPQLPLYAASQDQAPLGIAFAQIHGKQQRFLGVGDNALELEGIKPITSMPSTAGDWSGQLQLWQQQLSQLIEDFAQGGSELNPYNANTCTQCHLAALCRRQEVCA